MGKQLATMGRTRGSETTWTGGTETVSVTSFVAVTETAAWTLPSTTRQSSGEASPPSHAWTCDSSEEST